MATTKITSPDLFDLGSLNTALQLPNGTTAERPTSPSTGEWRYNTTTNLVEFWDGGAWRELESEDIPPTPSEHFNTVIYDGNGSTQSITGVGFQPDLVWIKERGPLAENHNWTDSTRGTNKILFSNSTAAQATSTTRITSFDSDGFSLGNNNETNDTGSTYVAWCWKANGGTTSSNGEGSITSDVQANTKAGFSIVKFTGTGANATVGHGLGAAPEIIIFKSSTSISGWKMYTNQTPDPTTQVMELSDPSGYQTPSNPFNSTAPSATVISLGSYSDVNNSGNDMMAYCFKSVAGYSKIGTYTGNASQNGPLVNTGFEPALLIVKNTNATANWRMVDNKRTPLNHRQKILFPNLDLAEIDSTDDAVDFLTNGFKISNDDSSWNANADNFLYIAFAADASSAPTLENSFNVNAFAGSGGSKRALTTGFSPSWVWIKNRGQARDHMEFDNVRLLGSELVPGNYTNLDAADFNTTANDFNSFDLDGFTVGSGNYTNEGGENMVAWSWKANSLPTINNDGDIQSIVSANQAAGFSIVRYDGTSTVGATIGHGLSAAPETVIIKCMNTASTNWINYYEPIGNNDYLTLNLTNDVDTYASWFTSSATTFTFGAVFGNTNTTGRQYIAYCFNSVAGFSKIGSYTGNGGTQSITGLGFKPNFIMFKKTDANQDWLMVDSARGGQKELIPNSSAAEYTMTNGVDSFDSDGWTMGANNSLNTNASNYVYVAFKENPTQYPIASGEMGYLVVAGGASGANSGAGGGAGGLRTTYGTLSGGGASAETNLTLATGTYTITVGAGGADRGGGSSPPAYGGQGISGSDSTITGNASVSTVGGGGGGSNSGSNAPPLSSAGVDGGSGGGMGPIDGGGETPGSGTANEGFAGGASVYGSPWVSGGGGGAGSVGGDRVGSQAGDGGNGLTIAISGSSKGYAGGGGGSAGTGTGFGIGTQGGGNGAETSSGTGYDGTTNTGGGGGGGGDTQAAGSGGSGIVVLRLNTSDYSGVTSGLPTVTTEGSETILTYTASGGYAHNFDIPAGKFAYLVVAGGGGSGAEGSSFTTSGGGGGAGGLRTSYGLVSGGGTTEESFATLSAGTYTITIGGGGGAATDGSASTITGNASVSTVGGGGGGQNSTGNTGGSGGGGGSAVSGPVTYAGGSGTTGEGFAGSIGDTFYWSTIGGDFAAGGGGGGAASGAVTTNAGTTGAAGEGGDGLPVGISGSNNYYSAGGGGFKIGTPVNGLGHHSSDSSGSLEPGQPNTGDGAPKWSGLAGFSGGSGVIILRMKTSDYTGTTTGSPTVTTDGSDTILTYTGSGTYVHS